MPSKKQQLQTAVLEYLAENGIADLSLRPLAASLGTSARMLMFHFKSREGLLRDVLEELQTRLTESFESVMAPSATSSGEVPLQRLWKWAIGRKNLPYLRLLYELQVLAIQNPAEYREQWRRISAAWYEMAFRVTAQPLRSDAMATLCVAVFDGLMLEYMTTKDRQRLTTALDKFVAMAHSPNPPEATLRSYTKSER